MLDFESSSDVEPASPAGVSDPVSSPFSGDFFGTGDEYGSEDFNWVDNDNNQMVVDNPSDYEQRFYENQTQAESLDNGERGTRDNNEEDEDKAEDEDEDGDFRLFC